MPLLPAAPPRQALALQVSVWEWGLRPSLLRECLSFPPACSARGNRSHQQAPPRRLRRSRAILPEPVAVQTPERLYAMVLNQSPTAVKGIRIDPSRLKGAYKTAVVRELSQRRRDEPIAQFSLARQPAVVDFPPYSLTQVIFVPEDLAIVEELKVEEVTATPGTLAHLDLHETTRLRTFGRIGPSWTDLTDLNIVWASSLADSVRVYHGGLTQRIACWDTPVTLTARTIDGRKRIAVVAAGIPGPKN